MGLGMLLLRRRRQDAWAREKLEDEISRRKIMVENKKAYRSVSRSVRVPLNPLQKTSPTQTVTAVSSSVPVNATSWPPSDGRRVSKTGQLGVLESTLSARGLQTDQPESQLSLPLVPIPVVARPCMNNPPSYRSELALEERTEAERASKSASVLLPAVVAQESADALTEPPPAALSNKKEGECKDATESTNAYQAAVDAPEDDSLGQSTGATSSSDTVASQPDRSAKQDFGVQVVDAPKANSDADHPA